jgi:hypothetical protein
MISFYGEKVMKNISSLRPNEQAIHKKKANEMYKKTINY